MQRGIMKRYFFLSPLMILQPTIFRAYDIRGRAMVDFDEDGFFCTAAALGRYLQKKWKHDRPKVFVSGDGRASQAQLYPAVVAGLEYAGCAVTWGGNIPTPVNYFARHAGDFDAAVQITASHNPPDDNGLKFTDRAGAIAGEEIQAIYQLTGECSIASGSGGECTAECKRVDFWPDYTAKLAAITPQQKPLHLVVDAGNGIAGPFVPEVLRHFGHEVAELYCDHNPTFPNHQPDPERPENLAELQKLLQEGKADFGFAFDGDGDRIGIVLPSGEILSADKIFFVLATDFLSRNPGATIVVDAMSSQTLIDLLRGKGANVIISKTGHSYIENAMHEHKALLGGEQSGHFMFGEDFYGHDDATLAALRFITAIENHPELLQAIEKDWPKMVEFSEKLSAPDAHKFDIVAQLAEELTKKYPDANTMDGVRIDFGNGEWAIVRCSNTSPKIAVRIEAQNPASLEAKKSVIVPALEAALKAV